jgi:hypothetical protein
MKPPSAGAERFWRVNASDRQLFHHHGAMLSPDDYFDHDWE